MNKTPQLIEFNAKIINSSRITIPKKQMRKHGLQDGATVHVRITRLVEA